MSYLLYCIFRGDAQPELELPAGVHGRPVQVMNHGGLSAGVSELRKPDSPPDVATVLAYENVVEFFFRRRTIIPMRYGCKVRDRMQLDALLEERHKECDALLSRLEGLAEMGIQVIADGWEPHSAAVPPASLPESDRPGVSYLLAKKLHYSSADRVTEWRNQLVKSICQPLSGMYLHRKVEPSSTGAQLVSLYFLLPRDSVEPFREMSRRCPRNGLAGLSVSGPWPPYNFADFSNINEIS